MADFHGKVLGGVGNLFKVLCNDNVLRFCPARGNLKRDEQKVVVGDKVVLQEGEEPGSLVITKIEDRKNILIRPPIANIDYMLVSASVSKPAPVLETIDKMTSILVHNHIIPIMVFTKSDHNEDYAKTLESIYTKSTFKTFVISSHTGQGVLALTDYLQNILKDGSVASLCGASGVGKSTLLNTLLPNLFLKTNDISQKIERGKHTTRTIELYPCFGGFLADTPGFSLLDFCRFDFFSLEDLPLNFPEFYPFLGKCNYTDCSHTKEGDECSVCRAVKEGFIPSSRHQSYCSIYQEIKNKNLYV